MKQIQKVPIAATTREEVEYIQCDLCKRKSERGGYWNRGYEVNEAEVEMKTGASYPDSGNTTATILDICPACFKDKLVPWFVSMGGVPRTEKADW